MDLLTSSFGVIALIFAFFFLKMLGRGKGGVVKTRFTADFNVLDQRFATCRPEADYSIFKEGKPHKIEIEVERLPLEPGDTLDVYINRQLLSKITVKRDLEAEFEHWSDDDVPFPQIKAGDVVDIVYQNKLVLSGVFQQRK